MSSRTRRRILVTGGAGYIGSHVVDRLLAGGYEPVVLDDLSTGRPDAVPPGSLRVGSITDREFVASLFESGIDAVVHLAAVKSVEASLRDPLAYARTNVGGTLTLIEASVAAGVREIVFSSSAAVYGVPERLPVNEDEPTQPANPYGETKLAVERILAWAGGAGQLRSVSLRYFNAAGAAPSGTIGEPWEHATNLIPIVLRAAWDGRPVHVYGTDYPTPDGTPVRDYIHVSDLADAHVRALEYLAAGGGTTVLNVGTGHGASVTEVIAAASRITGRPIDARPAPRRAGDPPAVWADATRAASTIGWKADLGLEDMLRSAWKWHLAQVTGADPSSVAAEEVG